MPTNLDTLRAQPLTLIGPATHALSNGGSIGAWRSAMETAIRRSQTAATIAAIKERTGVMPKGLSRAERADLDKRIASQLKYLDGFVKDLRAGTMSMAQAEARANLYSGATRGTYYATRYPGLSAYPGDGSTPCLGNCKCTLDERDGGVWWVLHPAEHCSGCVDMASGSPYQVETTKAQSDQEKAMFAAMGGGGGGGGGGSGGGKGGGKNTLWPKGPDGKRHDPGGGGGTTAAGATTPAVAPDGHSVAANEAHRRMLASEAEAERRKEPIRDQRRALMAANDKLYDQRGDLELQRAHMVNPTPAEKAALTRKINAIDKELHANGQKSEALLQKALAVDEQVTRDILKVDRPADIGVVIGHLKPEDRQRVQAATDLTRQLTSTTGLDGRPVRVEMESGIRASASDYGNTASLSGSIRLDPNDDTRVIAHELGHHIEYRNPEVKARANAFLARRTQGEAPQKLSVITGNQSYRDDEITRPDRFHNPYVGKIYSAGNTEIISMGIEELIADPVGFAKRDPDYFKFMYDTLRVETP